MKIERKQTIKTKGIPDSFMVGDRIKIKIDGKKRKATAVAKVDDGTLFLLNDCLCRMEMYEEGKKNCGYESSKVRAYLIRLQNDLPHKWLNRMEEDCNGDKLFLLSVRDVFGLDEEGNKIDGQIKYFFNPKNRIARVPGENYCAVWWLRGVQSAAYFCVVSYLGDADSGGASYSFGVRPAFIISDLESPDECPDEYGQ